MQKIKRDNPSYVLSQDLAPIYQAQDGETVQIETFDCFENQISDNNDTFEALDWERINPVTGPIFITGAEKGDTLAVDILSIDIADQIAMLTGPGLGVMGDELTENIVKICPIVNDKVQFNAFDIPLRKMIGVIGTAPAGEAVQSGVPDGHGGNMDCICIAEGATLYLPVSVEGALLFVGDLHAVMGDGEVAVCGGEVDGKVTLRLRVIKDNTLPLPALVNQEKIITIASEDTLDHAAVSATKNMCQVVKQGLKLDKAHATLLLSLIADLRVCQIVDPKMTMRMEVPRTYFHTNPYEKDR